MSHARSLTLASALVLSAFVGCNREQVESTRIQKALPVAPAGQASLPPNHPPIDSSQAAPPMGGVPAPGGPALKWTLPKGWIEEPGGGMRYATLRPAGGGTTELSVVSLAGPAGGELANVNRWRGQLGLPPIEEAALGQARKTVKSKAGTVSVFEFSNAGNRMIVGLLTASDGNTWFLKMVGEDAPVAKARAEFMQLMGTLDRG